jgi:hypothetical protein
MMLFRESKFSSRRRGCEKARGIFKVFGIITTDAAQIENSIAKEPKLQSTRVNLCSLMQTPLMK